MPEPPRSDLLRQLTDEGYAGPIPVLSAQECRRFLKAANKQRNEPPWDWFKGYGASSRLFYDLSLNPSILDVVTGVLGQDVMLWGASLLVRRPGAVHPWHSDIETAEAGRATITVWVGLEHTTRDSSLLLLPCSHQFGVSVQELRHHHGKRRDDTTDADVLAWARSRDERGSVMTLGVRDGEAVFFDGRLWHASNNVFSRTRRAVLLQYATPDTLIRIPDPNQLDWPFRYRTSPMPPCVMVRGTNRSGVNRIVAEPAAPDTATRYPLSPGVHPLQLPLSPADGKAWTPYPLFRGRTSGVGDLACHASVLRPNYIPHPPHRHEEEEILLMLRGEADLILPDVAAREQGESHRLRSGEFVYYPSRFTHTLQAVGTEPANYLMFKWRNQRLAATPIETIPFRHVKLPVAGQIEKEEPEYHPQLLFEGPTGWLRRIHCHVSTLAPGAGYAPHVDAYDVAIVALEGALDTIGTRVDPHGVVFYRAGTPHGMKNPGDEKATYLVFEFHGAQSAMERASAFWRRSLPTRLASPRYWKKTARRILQRIRKSHGAPRSARTVNL